MDSENLESLTSVKDINFTIKNHPTIITLASGIFNGKSCQMFKEQINQTQNLEDSRMLPHSCHKADDVGTCWWECAAAMENSVEIADNF